jgi:hypothetical protein
MRFTEPLCLKLRCSPAVRAMLERDLAAALREAGAEPNAFVVSLGRPPEVEVGAGATTVAVHLVGSGGIAHRARIAWSCRAHAGERVAPDDARTAERGCVLHARWIELPRDALRASAAAATEPAGARPFAVERGALSGPDVIVELELAHEPTAAELDALGERLEAWREAWNRRGSRGLIHSLGLFERLDARRFELAVDLGSAGVAAVEALLDALAREVELAPTRVALRGFSLR